MLPLPLLSGMRTTYRIRATFLSTVLGEETMRDTIRKRWLDLCAEAAICEDPERLQELSQEIVRMLKEEERRIRAVPQTLRIRA
jgi:hypothetical protein